MLNMPGLAARVVLGAQGEQLLDGDALHGLLAAEVQLDELAREAVDAGRNRGVGGEHRCGADRLERLVERERVGGGELVDALDAEEAGVALVGVVDVRGRGAGQARPEAQGADAAHAEQHLLLEALLAAAAVEAVGDVAGGLVVLGDVGVEEQQRDAADLRAPHVGVQLAAAGQAERDDARGAVSLAQQRQGQAVGVEDGVGLLLPAVAVEALLEVAGLVEQADADDRDAEVGGRLQVVAGEDAEAAGVLRQHLGDAELRAEVGDRPGGAALDLLGPGLVPAGRGEVGVEVGLGVLRPRTRTRDRRRGRPAPGGTGPTAGGRGPCAPSASAGGRSARRGRESGGARTSGGCWQAHRERRWGRGEQYGR